MDTLIVIVGKKISISRSMEVDTVIVGKDTILLIPFRSVQSKPKIIAVYEILELLYGNCEKDSIKFLFHNKDLSTFLSSDNLLLCLQNTNGTHYLSGEPTVVYKTVDNRWGSPCLYKYPTLNPQKIDFVSDVFFDISSHDDNYIKKRYPSPCYEIKGNKAVAIFGVYAEDLKNVILEGL